MPEHPSNIISQYLTIPYKMEPLPGEHDDNFYVHAENGAEFILKISHAEEKRSYVEMQNSAIKMLSKNKRLITPHLLSTLSGKDICEYEGKMARLFHFIPGKLFANIKYHSPRLLKSLGMQLAYLTQQMVLFKHESAKHFLRWDLQQASWVYDCVNEIDNITDRHIITTLLERIEPTFNKLNNLRQSIIHGDINDYNIIVSQPSIGQEEVAGFIDFGDLVETATICELAIAITYAVLNKPAPLEAAAHIIRGYVEVFPLFEKEIEVLFDLICLRLIMSVITSAQRKKQKPGEAYLTISEQPAWDLLRKLVKINPNYALYIFRDAAGFEPCPQTQCIVDAIKRENIHSLFEFDLSSANKKFLDLSVASLAEMPIENECIKIGLYNEARLCYTNIQYAEETNQGFEQRTIHLGLDIFVPAATKLLAPMSGVVHSFADNDVGQDYGPTLILEHQFHGSTFYTLYGHLSRETLTSLQVGKKIQKGEVLGSIGNSDVNGGWPAHLHFQIITDMFNFQGTFPGVAAASVKEVWLSICPDPNLIVRIPECEFPAPKLNKNDIKKIRANHTAKNLSLSYADPIEMVRGIGQYLYDENGRQYLDCINNVCHVGHCQVDVVQAGINQMRILNTNTRYLQENFALYTEQLCQTLPKNLDVCFLVCSGSEANELALRLAHAHTKKKNIVVLDHGYHGNTETLINISPYKFNGKGGGGKPDFVEIIPLPVKETFDIPNIKANTAAFIAEALPSCAGQIVLPKNFLKTVYEKVRAQGGVCIADEVQIGLGRVGSHFWGFETQDVIPDIVTIGKPLGNGHPLAAVITTKEIASSFENGMEYFNTFGGNSVSCAIGLSVLKVIARDNLQAHAQRVGMELKNKLQKIKEKYTCITDVRGLGLFLGIELTTKEMASYIVNRLKDRGILLSTDGPMRNVIKFKPPMAFTSNDGDFFIKNLIYVLDSI